MFRNRHERKSVFLGVFGHFFAKVAEAVERIAFGVARQVDDLLDVAAVSDLADQQPVDAQPTRVQNDEAVASLVLEVAEILRDGFDVVPWNEAALVGNTEDLGVMFGIADVIVEPYDAFEPVGEENGMDANAAADLKEDRVFGPASLRVERGALSVDVVQMDVRSDDLQKLFFGVDISRKVAPRSDVKLMTEKRHFESRRPEHELEFGLFAASEVHREPLKVEARQAGVLSRAVKEKTTEFCFFFLNFRFGQIMQVYQDGGHQPL